MKLQEQLAAEGIIHKRVRPGTYAIDCPKEYCKSARVAGDKDCLKLEIESAEYAHWKCKNCLWTGHAGEKPAVEHPQSRQLEKPSAPAAPATQLTDDVAKFLAERGITPEQVKTHGLVWDAERSAIKFPYRNNGETINAMLMNVPEGTTRLASSKRIEFYGADKLDPEEKQIIVAQREVDRLILERIGFTNVIALPNGGVLPRRETDSYERADDFEYFTTGANIFINATKVIIAFDTTPEGERLRQELVRRAGPPKCYNVKFYRDTLAETLKQDGEDFVCQDMNAHTAQPIRGLYEVQDFQTQLMNMFDGGMAAGIKTGWENVDQLYTVLPSQLTVITGIPNSGKSEWLDALTLNLAMNHGWRFGVFSPENGKELHVIKLTEKRVEMPSDPKSSKRMSRETFLSGASWVAQHYYFIASDVLDKPPTLDWILERAADAVLRYGIKGLIIDPWNRIVKKYENGQNEAAYVETALAQILRFAINHDVHIWLVAHPTKQEPDKKTGNFAVPSLYAISGGAHFVNMCDNGIVVYRPAGADNKFVTEIWVRKVRFKHVGEPGSTKLRYNHETGRFTPLDEAAASYMYGGTTGAPSDAGREEVDEGIQTFEPR